MTPRSTGLVTLLVSLAAGASALAQDQKPNEVVYVANAVNNAILRIDFAAGTSTAINTDAKTLKKLAGLVIRNDAGRINLIVTDKAAGNVLFYENVNGKDFDGTGKLITGDLTKPDGVSLDANGNVYLTASGAGKRSKRKTRQIWKLPRSCASCVGGYGEPEPIDDDVPSDALKDTKVVRSSIGDLQAGDLLVLSGKPAQVLWYPQPKPCTLDSCYPDRRVLIAPGDFEGAIPNGLAIDPDANLLLATKGGEILRFDPAQGKFAAPFFAGLGDTLRKIAVGAQGGESRVFVTQRGGNEGNKVYAFDIRDDGTGAPPVSVSEGLKAPAGVGIGTGSGAATRTGDFVKIQLNTVTSTFDKVRKSGITDTACVLFPDPRGGAQRDISLQELDPTLPDVIIPGFVRAFGLGSPTGPPTFFLCQGLTTASFHGTIDHVEEEEEWLHWDSEPLCDNPKNRDQESRLFWAPIPGSEPPVVESSAKGKPVFVDFSNGCTNSNRAVTPDYSYFLPAVQDIRPVKKILGFKLQNLDAALTDLSGFISGACKKEGTKGTLCQLREALQRARDAFECRDFAKVAEALDEFMAIIRRDAPVPEAGQCQAGSFDNCERNVSGELLARADSAKFMAGKLQVD